MYVGGRNDNDDGIDRDVLSRPTVDVCGRIQMKLYLRVTKDKYELPVAVADSPRELAKMTGVSRDTILSSLSHVKDGRIRNSIYKMVEVEDD